MINIEEVYKQLVINCQSIATDSLVTERLEIISENHSLIEDYLMWLTAIEGKPETYIYKIALREYQMALLANVMGLYNLAFTGLRFFLERTLISIMFSSKEIDLRLWEKAERDTYWSEIIDNDTGIFSHRFSRAFFPDLKEECLHFKSMTQKVYRECSEFVHGNISSQKRIPETLMYDKEISDDWHAKANTIKTIVLFAFCLRYLNHLKEDALLKVEHCVLDELSHISCIRSIFGGTK